MMSAILHNTFFNASLVAGILMMLFSFIIRKFPPRTMKSWYGYRSYLSTHNQKMWDEGNRYFTRSAQTLSWILIPWGFLAALLFSTQSKFFMYVTIVPVVVGILYICGATEWRLQKMLKPGENEYINQEGTDYPN